MNFFHSLFFFVAIIFLSLHQLVTENQILFFVVVVVTIWKDKRPDYLFFFHCDNNNNKNLVFGFQSLADATKETWVSRSITSCQIYYVLNLVLTIKQHDRTIVFNESFPTLNSLINEKATKNEHRGKRGKAHSFITWRIASMVENFLVCYIEYCKYSEKNFQKS